MSWSSDTRAFDRTMRKLSRRAVVASQPPTRSGCSMRSMFSTSRSQVTWWISATSASFRRQLLAIAITMPLKRSVRVRQAAWSPAAAPAMTPGKSPSSYRVFGARALVGAISAGLGLVSVTTMCAPQR
jgi:hypothetical protein